MSDEIHDDLKRAQQSAEAQLEAVKALAQLARGYYTELVVAGFDEDDAFELTREWQCSVLDND